ncbi:MAG: FeoA family protein [Verrucomicrobia bacterium]|nr:FeoA family protein [Verrucomicrobiota bacterium]
MSKLEQTFTVQDGQCAGPLVCPLSRVQVGMVVCVKQLNATPGMQERLRELGFCEQQRIKLLSRHSNLICLVCNSRLGISEKLADSIMVEALPEPPMPA